MAVQSWTNLGVYVGGYNVACRAKGFDAPNVTIAPLDTTSLCDDANTYIGGLQTVSWSADVMADFGANQVDDLIGLSRLGVAVPISVAPVGTTAGDVAYTFNARQFQYSPLQSQAGDLAMATVSGMGEGAAVRGVLMNAPATAITSTANTAGQQIGATSSTQSLYAALHVLSASGTTPTMDVVIQSDDNAGFTSATTRLTLTQATGIGSQWASDVGPVADDYWRAAITIGGGSPSFTYALVLGIANT